ncbi:hypothetical protein BJY52DRAFT_1190794 [Lactarius psammicola]|nr:hypothetical protein BJY52DRAFT_1190794 [Lactarius psammicola]
MFLVLTTTDRRSTLHYDPTKLPSDHNIDDMSAPIVTRPCFGSSLSSDFEDEDWDVEYEHWPLDLKEEEGDVWDENSAYRDARERGAPPSPGLSGNALLDRSGLAGLCSGAGAVAVDAGPQAQ